MEQIEDSLVDMIQKFNIGEGLNTQEAQQMVIQNMNNSIQQTHVGKSPAEIMEITNQTQDFMTRIFNRANIPLETKLMNEREFIFYKFADSGNICPSLKSFERKDRQFLIKYKTHVPIEILTEDKKELVICLIVKLHKMGIFHGNTNKENFVYNEYEGIKLTDFSEALWIDEIDEQILLNNSYGKSCTSIEELLELELNKINEIFEFDLISNDNLKFLGLDHETIKEKNSNDDHFHSSDEDNVYY